MTDDEWDDNEFPLAYLITIRTFGTWLHGDERGSVDRHGKNIYGTPRVLQNRKLEMIMREELTGPPFILDGPQRRAVEAEIRDVCSRRNYKLLAINVRTNHFHAVVSAEVKPENIIVAFKANTTRAMRENELVAKDTRVWSRGKSRRYLWKPRNVEAAIDYTLYAQGDDLFETWLDEQDRKGNGSEGADLEPSAT